MKITLRFDSEEEMNNWRKTPLRIPLVSNSSTEVLNLYYSRKIEVLKTIREITGCGLRDAIIIAIAIGQANTRP